jgi:hypothetical protein
MTLTHCQQRNDKMTLETTRAYITIVGPDHTVVVPDDIAVGATVAVVVMSTTPDAEAERQARFAATLAAIRAASAPETTPAAVTDTELEALIKEARQTSPG